MRSVFKLSFLGVVIALLLTSCGGNQPQPPAPNPTVTPHVQIGTPGVLDSVYLWSPAASLDNPNVAQPIASPAKTTQYTVTVTNKCGTASSSVTVHVFKKDSNGKLEEILQ